MARVIAVQEGQLQTLRKNYVDSISKTNNADILSGALASGVIPTMPTLDMEQQPVNLNSVSAQSPSVVNNDITNQVFGVQGDAVQVNPVLPTVANEVVDVKAQEVPYNEPIMSSNMPINVLSDEAYIEYINALRNKLTTFYDDMNSELDKIQEQIVQKSGVSLVETTKNIEPVVSSAPVTVENPMSNFNMNNGSVNIFDMQPQSVSQMASIPSVSNYDETMVIPRDVMNDAISDMQKVA